jgi:PEGA domain
VPPAPATGPTDAQKQEAKQHFDKGLALFDESAWDAALAEFMQSRTLFPTRAATKDAGVCLRKLHRFDEALDEFESLLRDFQNVPADERAFAEAQIKELSGFVGTVTVQGAEPGSKVLIDGRERGDAPTPALRVSAGTHVLRVSHEGFAPFEVQFSVAGAQASVVKAKLAPLLQGGRLHVEEASGKTVDVLVDGTAVGQTPWEGMLPVGDHVVALRGEGDLGTQPSLATVKLNASTPVTLRAEPLPAKLRIEPTPAGATVVLDGVTVGHGVWAGRVRVGGHALEVRAEGYATDQERVVATADKETTVNATLRQLANEASGRVFVEVDGGLAFSPSFGGDLASGCSSPCKQSNPLGFQVLGHGGYQLGSGLALSIDAGFLSLSGKLENRAVALKPRGLADNLGTATDSLTLSGLSVGPAAAFHAGSKFPILARVGVGVLLANLKDSRSGTASTNDRTTPQGVMYTAQPYDFSLSESQAARYLYVAPEFRVGLRFADRFELAAGLRALFLIGITQPKWADQNPVSPGASYNVGELTFGDQALAGSLIVVLTPGLSARVDF